MDGKHHARHEFALMLKNAGMGPLSLSGYEAAISYFGVQISEMTGPLLVTLPAGREYRLTLHTLHGHDVTLLFDTGAQVCLLSPEVARRLGIAVPPDAPSLALVGGGSGGGALVQLPPVRVGDYVVEHLTGAITSLAGFPFAIDGVLGTNFIEAFRVTIDHRARELRLEPR